MAVRAAILRPTPGTCGPELGCAASAVPILVGTDLAIVPLFTHYRFVSCLDLLVGERSNEGDLEDKSEAVWIAVGREGANASTAGAAAPIDGRQRSTGGRCGTGSWKQRGVAVCRSGAEDRAHRLGLPLLYVGLELGLEDGESEVTTALQFPCDFLICSGRIFNAGLKCTGRGVVIRDFDCGVLQR